MEPFRIKVVEALPKCSRSDRVKNLIDVGFMPFRLQARHVIIDLTTDSGTSALSQNQWAAMMRSDETYNNSTSFERFEQAVRSLTNFPHIAPVHQGRAAEVLLFKLMLTEGSLVVSNGLFVTTKHNIREVGATSMEIPCQNSPGNFFGGNIDCEQLIHITDEMPVSMVIITVTNTERAGQPVSMANQKELYHICKTRNIPLYMDGCRFAENAFFIKEKEEGFADKDIKEIASEMFSYLDGCYVSAKKDGLANIGGFFATSNKELFDKLCYEMMWSEGSASYGGLAGRDLDAIAVGLDEVTDEDYLRYRVSISREFGEILKRANVPVIDPVGCAIYVDAVKALPHIPQDEYPARALNCALYIEGGVKGFQYNYQMGTITEGRPNVREVLRLSLPRRVYTLSHLLYVGEVFKRVLKKSKDISGLKNIPKQYNFLGKRMIPIKGFIFASEADDIQSENETEK